MAGLAVTKEGEFGSLFHYSVSHFTFILQQKHIRDCAISSVLHFHHLFVAKSQEGGGEPESAVGNSGCLSLQ
jgi:hypothetical protein